MSIPPRSEILPRALFYAQSREIELVLEGNLGWGTDGYTWDTSRHSVVKALYRASNFHDELECYRRLEAAGISEIFGLAVPELIDSFPEIQIIEIGIVEPPCIIDFGKVSLDHPPDYWSDGQKRADWYEKGEFEFEERWQDVLDVLGFLQHKLRIWYTDPSPYNIMFGDECDGSSI